MYAGLCLLMLLFAAGGLVYGVMSGLIFARDALFTLDGILLTLVCLTIGAVFGLMLLLLAMNEGWIKLPRKKDAAGSEPEPPK